MPRGRPIATVRNHRRFNPFGALDPRQPIPCLSHDRVRRYLGNRARDGRRANRSGTDHPLAWEARVTSRTTATRVPLDELNLVGVLERGDGKGVVCALCRLVGGSRRPLTARGRYDFLSASIEGQTSPRGPTVTSTAELPCSATPTAACCTRAFAMCPPFDPWRDGPASLCAHERSPRRRRHGAPASRAITTASSCRILSTRASLSPSGSSVAAS